MVLERLIILNHISGRHEGIRLDWRDGHRLVLLECFFDLKKDMGFTRQGGIRFHAHSWRQHVAIRHF